MSEATRGYFDSATETTDREHAREVAQYVTERNAPTVLPVALSEPTVTLTLAQLDILLRAVSDSPRFDTYESMFRDCYGIAYDRYDGVFRTDSQFVEGLIEHVEALNKFNSGAHTGE